MSCAEESFLHRQKQIVEKKCEKAEDMGRKPPSSGTKDTNNKSKLAIESSKLPVEEEYYVRVWMHGMQQLLAN